MIGRLPLDEQLGALREVLSRNDVLLDVLARTATLDLPGWYLTAGCLFQTVWNVVTDRPPTDGIKDYDVFYFDDGALSWEAEDRAIQAGREAFAGVPAEVEIRNEARVHLWYEERVRGPVLAVHVHRGGDRQLRGDDMLPGRTPATGRPVAGVRAARPFGRVQPRRPAEPGACPAVRL
jgi:hypothetical protein